VGEELELEQGHQVGERPAEGRDTPRFFDHDRDGGSGAWRRVADRPGRGAAAACRPGDAASVDPREGEAEIVRSSRPINLETPLKELTSYYTPTELFFVRNNYDPTPIDPAQWSLRIEGEVNKPLVLGVDDLKKLPMITQDVTIECAGNGRSFHKPQASGVQWAHARAGAGLDRIGVEQVGRAAHGDHRRVRWVVHEAELPGPSGRGREGHLLAPGLEVKSVIVGPSDGDKVKAGVVAVWGWAWTGEGELTGIDISTDGGQTWRARKFVGQYDRYSWRKWEYTWDAKPGSYAVMARATDSLGRIQPTSRAWNPLGYRWNVIHAIKVDVA
jgi:DMSO/TMAO reductase YedYZ molybdopterin-dependent catalytic subunit